MEAGNPSRRKRKLEKAPAAAAERGAHGLEPPPRMGEGEEGGAAAADRISDLPDPILADIVSLLPTKDGVCTQILASRWRHLWRSASLNLDCDGHDGLYYYLTEDDDRALAALAALIPRLLSAHPGPGRRFCVPACYLRSRSAAVDAWLRSPTLDGLHELEFCDVYACEPTRPLPPLSALPASAFRFSATLRVATIRACHLPDSTAQALHFPQLKKLALVDVVVSETWLHSMIAGCPALECLLIHTTSGVRRIRINSLSLRCIGVRVGCQRTNELQLQELIIENAPCLERLLCLNLLDGLQVSVTSAPKFQTIACVSDRRDFSTSLMIGCDAVIQGLHLDRLTVAVCTVKILAVDLFMFDLDTVIALMRCFPCLEKLYLESVPGGYNLWRRKHRDLIKCFDIRLKTIGLGSYRGIKSQVDFVTFFILNAKVLELMIVHVSPQDYYRGFAAEESRKLKFQNRASKGAQIHFTTDTCLRGVSEINDACDLDLTDPFITRC
ncbi:FBD-associated F-box protein At5g60610-like [Lolium rigidum]|uniref:FBD-associated F-box protein At5g60610-like n=1 Tax=Lolium rigidum TaxID=89674 RepID=UPI001F5E1C47|nr:FBD-associated F-box protein At5g60610-like [Lolium rigidum]